MPVALISTRTSPAFGPSRSSSTISSGFFAWKATAARVFIVILHSLFKTIGRHVARYSADSAPPHAGIFRLGVSRRLVFVLRGPHAADRVVGAGAEIDVEIVHVAGDVWIIAECRHDVFLRRADFLSNAAAHA